MAGATELVSLVAAVVSAIGGAFAARAAFLSARSARETQLAADDAERRATRRDLGRTAAEVIIDCGRVERLRQALKSEYGSLAIFNGGYGDARMQIKFDEIDGLAAEAEVLKKDAALFFDGAASLLDAPVEEIDRVLLRQQTALTRVQSLRVDFEREYTQVERQNAESRARMDATRPR